MGGARVRTSSSSGKQMTNCDFPWEVRTPPPLSLSAHIRVSNSLNSHLFIYIDGPGQFTNRLLIISADIKGKDSMILFKLTSIPAMCCFKVCGGM